MATPRRFAALAVCLLALAGGAAAGACDGIVGSFQMQLVEASGTGSNPNPNAHEVATCLTSVTVNIAGDCKVALESNSADGVFVPSLWASASNYAQLQQCPATSVDAAKGTAGSPDKAGVAPALLDSIKNFVYGGGKNSLTGTPTIDITAGVVTVQSAALTPAYVFKYAITQVSLAGAVADVTAVTSTTTLPTDAKQAVTGDSCAAGRYGVILTNNLGDELKLCPLCPAGHTGNGDGCTACLKGTASAVVGTDTCATTCNPGDYAQAGSSACLPCPTGTYSSASGQGECSECPNDSYAWIPGSTGCLRCIAGTPKCVAGDITGFTCTDNSGTGSPGYHILNTLTVGAATCASLSGTYAIEPFKQCNTWTSAAIGATVSTLQLSLFVNGDCSVTISPISDKTCADMGAKDTVAALMPFTVNQNGVDASGNYDYTYNDLLLLGYYATPKAIRSLLPSDASGSTSSMLAIDWKAAGTVDIKFWAATNKPADATTLLAKTDAFAACSLVANAAGGKVFEGTTLVTTCPAGSYYVTDEGCRPCMQGYYCEGGLRRATCTADTANPYLGATADTYCATCQKTPAELEGSRTYATSYAGAGYCTVPYLERNCQTDGTYWDESSSKCEDCPAGTFRVGGDDVNLECQLCPIGMSSLAKKASCDPCPAGQYSPSKGLADQTAISGTKCLLCPKGSIALVDDGVTTQSMNDDANLVDYDAGDIVNKPGDYRNKKPLSQGATKCEACPAGTYAAADTYGAGAVGCTPCAARKYRTGDASPQNNECKLIPAGYKASKTLAGATAVNPGALVCTDSSTDECQGAYEITACGKGTISSWSGTTRSPLQPLKCAACTGNTYAPRTGMTACIACKGGFIPDTSVGADGPDYCKTCNTGYYRSFYTASNACTACDAGYEVGPTARQACTQCRPGYYKDNGSDGTGDTDFCSPCEMHTYMARPGATSCTNCPKGYETQDTGNSECSPCSAGYFKKGATKTACEAAPAGTFVNTSAAYFTTPCPLGTFNDKTGQDSCDPCAPGSYANALGSRTCKTCPAGTFSPGQASTCKACNAGYYSPAGSGACSPCKPGTYANLDRAGTCALCPKGFQCPTPATKTPRACPAGTYAAKDGSVLCAPCPVNFISTTTGQKQCTACPKGSNTRGLTGQTKCQAVRVTSLRRSVL